MSKRALIVVDVQYDFLPGGALAVPEGNAVIPVINEAQKGFELVVATQDWHPADHGSFASRHPGKKPGDTIELNGLDQILWPDHCVQNSRGAELAEALDRTRTQRVFRKGMDPGVDSYSGFFDNGHRHDTGLAGYLREQGVGEVSVAGLATDYCVKHTVLDAVALGFRTTLLRAGCRGVNLAPGDVERACEAMRRAGAQIE